MLLRPLGRRSELAIELAIDSVVDLGRSGPPVVESPAVATEPAS
jgi:hypothetical protein